MDKADFVDEINRLRTQVKKLKGQLASIPNDNVVGIVSHYLLQHGYNGLADGCGCYCFGWDLMPCGGNYFCRAAHLDVQLKD